MKCLVCEKQMWATELGDDTKLDQWPQENRELLMDGGGEITIYCNYGSIHDQCDTYPFLAVICDECITKKKPLMNLQEGPTAEVWQRRRERSQQLARELYNKDNTQE